MITTCKPKICCHFPAGFLPVIFLPEQFKWLLLVIHNSEMVRQAYEEDDGDEERPGDNEFVIGVD